MLRESTSAAGFKSAWRRARAKAGITKFRNHDLRHAFGTALYEETGDIYAVQKAMGHADVKTTMRYVHRRQATVNEAIAEIAKNRLRKVQKTSGQKGGQKSPRQVLASSKNSNKSVAAQG